MARRTSTATSLIVICFMSRDPDQPAAAAALDGAPAAHSYTPGQLVWVRVGKTDHHAHVVAVGTPKCKVKWCSTLDIEEVDVETISPGLTPRKRGRSRRQTIVWDSEGDVEGTRTKQQRGNKANGGTMKNEDKKKGGRLSLGRNRRMLAKARREKRINNGPDDESETSAEQTTKDTAEVNADGSRHCEARKNLDAEKEASAAARVVTPATTTATIVESPRASPKNVSLEVTRNQDQGDADANAGAYQTPVISAATKRAMKRPASSVDETDSNNSCRVEAIDRQKDDLPNYHLNPVSSAYVQHIAEICHAILNDMRWRVPVPGLQNEGDAASDRISSDMGRTRSILAWESGEDLSAVSAFAGVWDGKIGGQSDLLCPGISDDMEGNGNDGCEDSGEQLLLGRALLLYSRLERRRGPWFTIDDLYFRYYRHYFSVSNTSSTSTSTDDTGTELPGDDVVSAGAGNDDISSSDGNGLQSVQLPTLFDHQAALVYFFKDIVQLHNMRLIRSFDSERECGIVAGNTSSDGSGVLLNASERSEVLNRLGGGKHLKRRNTGLNRGNSEGSSGGWGDDRGSDDRAGRRRNRFSGAADNLIWQQMTTQRSVFSSAGSSAILPVRRHVDETVLRKFGVRILGSVGNTSRSRSNISHVTSIIDQAWNEAMKSFQMVTDENSLEHFVILSSIRLREAPLLSLRRASRLYLCAVGGSGSMRGDSGTSGWASVSESTLEVSTQAEDTIPVEALRVLESGGSSWHRVSFPGLSSRFGLSSFCFAASYEPILYSAQNARTNSYHLQNKVRVFSDQGEFRRWEVCAELRAAIDTLMELNEVIQSLSRRKKKQEIDDEDVEDTSTKSAGSKSGNGSCKCDESIVNAVPIPDNLNLLTSDGRKDLVGKLSVGSAASTICSQVEATLRSFEDASDGRTDGTFTNDAERIIFVLSVIGLQVLQSHFSGMSLEHACRLAQRPWLRHLVWESALAYLLWDCVAVLEKKKCYGLAVSILETILMGAPVQKESLQDLFDPFVRSLISRRVRGKAIERLIIDRGHLEKVAAKSQKMMENSSSKGANRLPNDGKKIKCVETSEENTPIQQLCLEVITKEGAKSSIPFSAVRSLARRLKVPLKETLAEVDNAEMKALEIRCENDGKQTSPEGPETASAGKAKSRKRQSGYVEWTPTTDFSVANSIENEAKDGVGKRCAYVGWDDEDYSGGMARARPMNVEEHALAEYSAGRLPNLGKNDDATSTNTVTGGWVGWHDEGGHVRALFRILCANEIFAPECSSSNQCTERHTIYLSPYHGAPLDLHVATQCGSVRGFYERRRSHIEAVLGDLERLSPQQICDLVHRSISERMEANSNGSRDALLCRDVGEIRTLSFLAAALGGKALAAIFRCLCYDYRHYAGGLPDLTMARAVYEAGCVDDDNKERGTGTEQLVDLGSWVGEAFDAEEIEKGQVVELCRILADRDDEFLGCSKVGETGAGSFQPRVRQRRGKKQDETTKRGEERLSSEAAVVPPKLKLSHQGRTISVQSMFVEVKSANDRLDARQEDWLNVLSQVANARVCKFSAKKKAKRGTNS